MLTADFSLFNRQMSTSKNLVSISYHKKTMTLIVKMINKEGVTETHLFETVQPENVNQIANVKSAAKISFRLRKNKIIHYSDIAFVLYIISSHLKSYEENAQTKS